MLTCMRIHTNMRTSVIKRTSLIKRMSLIERMSLIKRMSGAIRVRTVIRTTSALRPAAGSACCWITRMTITSTNHSLPASALLRLLQLVSPALPIGGYNFSQGLEFAIEAGWVRDEASALDWISGLMSASVGTLDVAALHRLHEAWCADDIDAADRWSRFLIASRETSELRAEDRHLGRSLAKVLAEAGVARARDWQTRPDATFATLFALGCSHWGIGADQCAWGYLWTWAENQVLAAVKAVPLGQSAGQRMLDALITRVPHIAQRAATLPDEEIGSSAPLHLIASAAHETQYTRLFRS
jgi:urease accessory protein